jgi:hypothetical protein
MRTRVEKCGHRKTKSHCPRGIATYDVFHSPLWHRHNMHGLQNNLLRFPAVAAQRFAFSAN